MSDHTSKRELTQRQRLLRIAEMFGTTSARSQFAKPVTGIRDMDEQELYTRWVGQLSKDDRDRWVRDYDFVTRPFTLHLVRIYPQRTSQPIPEHFGDWDVVHEATLANGATAYKLQRDKGARTYRVGWYDEEATRDADRAVAVIRWPDRLIEIRAPYDAAKKLAQTLQKTMKLEEARLLEFTFKEYDQLMDRFDTSYTRGTLETQDPEIAEFSFKASPGRHIGRRRSLSVKLGADGTSPAREITDRDQTKESGWYHAKLSGQVIIAHFHRRRGTFHTRHVLRESEIEAVVQAFKAVKGW